MPENAVIARWVLLAGLGLILLAGIIWLLGRFNFPLGGLPGDFRFQSENFSCFIPLASSLLISVLLTLILNLVLRSMRK